MRPLDASLYESPQLQLPTWATQRTHQPAARSGRPLHLDSDLRDTSGGPTNSQHDRQMPCIVPASCSKALTLQCTHAAPVPVGCLAVQVSG